MDDQLDQQDQSLVEGYQSDEKPGIEGDGFSIEHRPHSFHQPASWAGQLQYRGYGEHRRGPSNHER